MSKSKQMKGTKRKDNADVAAVLGGGADSDSEDDTAKQLWLKKYKQDITPMHSMRTGGGSTPKIILEGAIVRADVVSRGGKPKLECQIDVHKMRSNGAHDVINSGVDGIEFLVPSQAGQDGGGGGGGGGLFGAGGPPSTPAHDDSPEGGGGNLFGGKKKPQGQGQGTPNKMMAPPRTLALSPNHKTIWLGSVPRVGFFTTVKGGGGKEEEKEGSKLLVPGMLVRVTGVVANLDASGSLWLNAASCEPRLDGIVEGTETEHIVGYMAEPAVMAKNAFLWSQTMAGFFRSNELSRAHETQAEVFKQQWVKARDGLAAACDAKAMAIRAEKGTDGEPMACVVDDHAARFRATAAADYAFGSPFFNDKMPPSPEYPTFTGGLVHDLVGMDFPQHKYIYGLFDKSHRDAVPETFVAPTVHSVEVKGAMAEVRLKLTFIGSKAAAVDSIKVDKEDPTLDSGTMAACAFKINMRKDVPINTGVLHAAKAADLIVDLLTYGKWAVMSGVAPRDPSDSSIVAPWGTWVPNMRRSIAEIAVLVDEAFVIEHLAGGASQYAFEQDPDVSVITAADGTTPVTIPELSLKKNGYKEITGATFKFAATKMPIDRPAKQYRVWWAGATSLILDDTDVLADAVAGKKAVEAAAAESSLSVTDFFMQRACVYVVAV